jgi:transposase-like protein
MKSRDFRNDAAGRAASTPPGSPPAVCPACQSRSIRTTARHPDESAYWRCDTCGEVWNASRREAASIGRYPRW